MASRMTIRCGALHTLRHRCFLFSSSLLLLCLLKLVYINVRVKNSFYLEPYGFTASYFRTWAHGHNINCTRIYKLEPVEIGKSLELRRKANVVLEDDRIVSLSADCERFVKTRRYNDIPVFDEELKFPLAYSLVVHKNAPMVERILRAIYAPHNIYCIHYDKKSTPAFIKAMKNMANCLPNLFIASKIESVEYAHITRLNADLNCISDMLKSDVKWEYVINLCGQDFPLKTNYELVMELKALNGSNMLESSRPSELKKQRFVFQYELQNMPYEYHKLPVKTTRLKDAAPHSIQVFIGSAYFVLSRDFVTFVTTSPVAKDFLAWSADTYSPDEHFWATLVRVPEVPGHILRTHIDITDLQSKTRLVKWNYLEGSLYPPCTGTHMRSVCIYGAAELRWLLNYGHWFANKFDLKVDPIIINCLEEKLDEKRKQRGNMLV
ncbi:beta-1,3-galactosyl-O-glycosyl-glycoprotein beta-1,6-N-acetylglucosaminyltransferase 4 isoform X1 [Gadus macrocephalus]|uniref:beta-1,3-galactosyl-O-glycosyl-glycoprotein beta-1,6-N-acetylglucosaminyltransferase 4 isoform X1 n=2 Tax=Gadus macrocephalus TaxID=80720 RepID=UPI0028CB87B0|nr:beta-1,3-galactosyl-O-glycosyl-glycoprotein beta-1,6-N-acetylglucosaminyltransferase 4 isoform X1 [Gadus macrocephalus]